MTFASLAALGSTGLAALLSLCLGLKFEAPAGWESLPKSSMMRVAEFKLPRAEGDTEDAQVAVYNFGSMMGGSVEANIARWLGQFDPKEGEPSIVKPKDEKADPKITIVDVTGTYVAETRPGSGEKLNKPGWRMIAAVVESKEGTYYVKAVGPKASIAKNADAIKAYAASAKPE